MSFEARLTYCEVRGAFELLENRGFGDALKKVWDPSLKRMSRVPALFLESLARFEVLWPGAGVLSLKSSRKLELGQLPCKAPTAPVFGNTHRVLRGHGGGYFTSPFLPASALFSLPLPQGLKNV